ncbi:hypothetical protein PHYBOEH_009001 [Phytophthora boehmeriae]|uniref:Uncharacterized protein n=1 Tax=Phytophthora boehmeriae TaxID=109152 RepID=A0A8T1VZZ0_9STRA|nr:hypothetical protein PHYBOEH_009001 [Phytophthora boehmeriae]
MTLLCLAIEMPFTNFHRQAQAPSNLLDQRPTMAKFVYFASLLVAVAFQMAHASPDAAEQVTTETDVATDDSKNNGTYYVLEERCCLNMI